MDRKGLHCRRFVGFTLIEVLLAALIVALIGGSLYAVFAAGLRLDQRAKDAFRDIDEIRLINENLYRDFGRMMSYDFRGSVPEQKGFSDDGKELLFLIDDERGGSWVRYRLMDPETFSTVSVRVGQKTKKNVAFRNEIIKERTLKALVREQGNFVQMLGPMKSLKAERFEILSFAVLDGQWKMEYAVSISGQKDLEWKENWQEFFPPGAVRMTMSLLTQTGEEKKWTRVYVISAGGRDEI